MIFPFIAYRGGQKWHKKGIRSVVAANEIAASGEFLRTRIGLCFLLSFASIRSHEIRFFSLFTGR